MKILITGATGFIGKRLTAELIKEDHEVFLLVRRQSLEKARAIFGDSAKYIIGDITQNDIVEEVSGAQLIRDEIDTVLHLAAYYDLSASMAETYLHNVIGTQNLLFLMQKMERLKTLHYVSTYAVSGVRDGDFSEEDLDAGVEFPDNYSKTKMQAEFLVRNAKLPSVKKRIYRPGIIVGDSRTGEMDKVDGPYYFFKFFHSLHRWVGKIPVGVLPVSYDSEATIPLLPVDTLVDWLKHMILHPTIEEHRTYHLLPSEKIQIGQFIEESLKAFDLNLKVHRVPFPKLYAKVLPFLKVPKEVASYMHSRTRYSQSNLSKDYPKLRSPKLKNYLPNLIERFKETQR